MQDIFDFPITLYIIVCNTCQVVEPLQEGRNWEVEEKHGKHQLTIVAKQISAQEIVALYIGIKQRAERRWIPKAPWLIKQKMENK